MNDSFTHEDEDGKLLGHVRVIELGEAKGRLAELAVFLVGVGQPLGQTVLVDKTDASAAFARVEERLGCGSFATAYPARIALFLHPVG